MSLYCSINARSCERIDCTHADELMNDVECACLSANELERLHDLIENNSDRIAELISQRTKLVNDIKSDYSSRLAWLQSLIDDNKLKIGDTNFRIDHTNLQLGNLIKDFDLLNQYTKDFLKDVIDDHTDHINDLNKDVFGHDNDIYNLSLKFDNLDEKSDRLNDQIRINQVNIDKILSTLFGQGIFIEGVTDTEELPDFGQSDDGPCQECAKVGDTNNFTGDNFFHGALELHNRDFIIRHPYPKGQKPSKQSHLDVQWKDNAGDVTSDNVSSVASMIEPNGDVKTALRSYRYVSGSIEHCDIILTTPQRGESYVELSNLKIGTQYNEYQCGTGWLETWDWIKGHTDLTIEKNVHLNTNGGNTTIEGPTHIHNTLKVDKDTHLNIVGGSTTIEGDTHINNTFEVKGDSHFHSNVHVDKNVTVNGNVIADGVVEGNDKADINGNSAVLLRVKGYNCEGGGPYEVFTIKNGYLTPGMNGNAGIDRWCNVAKLLGGLMIEPITGAAEGDFAPDKCGLWVNGNASLFRRVSIGYKEYTEKNAASAGSRFWDFGGLSMCCIYGDLEVIGRGRGQIDGNYHGFGKFSGGIVTGDYCSFNNGMCLIGRDVTGNGNDVHFNAAKSSFGGQLTVKGLGVEGKTSIGYQGGGGGSLDVNGNINCATINGSPYVPCSCGAKSAMVMNLLRDNDEDNRYTLISGLGDSNTINGIANPEIDENGFFEQEIELPTDFIPGSWTVQVTYKMTKDFDKSRLKELVPLVVEVEPDSTNRFKVYGNLLGYSWSATGNTE